MGQRGVPVSLNDARDDKGGWDMLPGCMVIIFADLSDKVIYHRRGSNQLFPV